MQRKKLYILLSIMIIIFITVVLIVIYNKNIKFSNGKYQLIFNTNENVISNKNISNITFSDIKYSYDGKVTLVQLVITNNNSKGVKIGNFNVIAYDENGNKLLPFHPVYNEIISSNESIELAFSLEHDLSSAYRLEIELPELELVEE